MMNVLKSFFEEKSRWLLWWPVGMGTGISLYFSVQNEPSFLCALIPFIGSLFGIFILLIVRKKQTPSSFWALAFFSITFSISCGFFAAKIRTDWLSTPFLLHKIDTINITARVAEIEELPNRHRLTLDNFDLPKPLPPLRKIRLSLPVTHSLGVTIGDRVSLTLGLLPLSEPVSLSGYNFRRQAYFQEIGAIGRPKSPLQTKIKKENNLWLSWMRFQLTQTIRQRLPGQTGEIASALITGDRSGISPNIRQAFTDAGLAHILAISGLHLTLVAGLIFLTFRRGLALIPYLAENYPIKKWAAILVIFATFAYLSISGFGIPGQRAFVMITISMVGIILDRNPLSMRLVALAATVILTLRPESLLSASFQLSFAAVIGLIAAYEGGWTPLRQWSFEGGTLRRLVVYGAGMISTTFIATLATTPYTIALFNRFTLQAIVGNFLAIPLTSFLIMPAATISVFSLLGGGFDYAFQIFSFGLCNLIHIAEMVSSWPGAALLVPTPPLEFLGLVTLGCLWICLWKNRWRWGGLILCLHATLLLLLNKPTTLYAAGDGSVLAYVQDNTLYASSLEKGKFYTDQWMKEQGARQKKEWPQHAIKIGPVHMINQPFISGEPMLKITKEMCSGKALITTGYAWHACKRYHQMPEILIDKYTLKRDGSYEIFVTSKNLEVKSVRAFLGKRPWSYG